MAALETPASKKVHELAEHGVPDRRIARIAGVSEKLIVRVRNGETSDLPPPAQVKLLQASVHLEAERVARLTPRSTEPAAVVEPQPVDALAVAAEAVVEPEPVDAVAVAVAAEPVEAVVEPEPEPEWVKAVVEPEPDPVQPAAIVVEPEAVDVEPATPANDHQGNVGEVGEHEEADSVVLAPIELNIIDLDIVDLDATPVVASEAADELHGVNTVAVAVAVPADLPAQIDSAEPVAELPVVIAEQPSAPEPKPKPRRRARRRASEPVEAVADTTDAKVGRSTSDSLEAITYADSMIEPGYKSSFPIEWRAELLDRVKAAAVAGVDAADIARMVRNSFETREHAPMPKSPLVEALGKVIQIASMQRENPAPTSIGRAVAASNIVGLLTERPEAMVGYGLLDRVQRALPRELSAVVGAAERQAARQPVRQHGPGYSLAG